MTAWKPFALAALFAALLALGCGGSKLTQGQICGSDAGCDACIGAACDGGR